MNIDGSIEMLDATSGRAKEYMLDKGSFPLRCAPVCSVIAGKFEELLADIDTVPVFGLELLCWRSPRCCRSPSSIVFGVQGGLYVWVKGTGGWPDDLSC